MGNDAIMGRHSFTGVAKPREEAALSFKVSGTLTKVYVNLGQQVKKGQALAQIDPTDYKVALDQSLASVENAKAQIESALAQLENAKANFIASESNYKRFEKLYETNSIALSDFEQAKSNYLSAQANYKASQTQVEAARASSRSTQSSATSASNQVNYTTMKAPFDGVITLIAAEENEVVGQGSPVLFINSASQPDVEVGIPENVISEITTGQSVGVQFNSLHDVSFNGKVHEVGYSLSGSTYPVNIRLEDSDDRIRPGMPASATFHFNDHHSNANSMIVPSSAVGEDGKGNYVYKLTEHKNGFICQKTHVEVGDLSSSGFEVSKGLKTGDRVASAGLNVLRDSMPVKLFDF